MSRCYAGRGPRLQQVVRGPGRGRRPRRRPRGSPGAEGSWRRWSAAGSGGSRPGPPRPAPAPDRRRRPAPATAARRRRSPRAPARPPGRARRRRGAAWPSPAPDSRARRGAPRRPGADPGPRRPAASWPARASTPGSAPTGPRRRTTPTAPARPRASAAARRRRALARPWPGRRPARPRRPARRPAAPPARRGRARRPRCRAATAVRSTGAPLSRSAVVRLANAAALAYSLNVPWVHTRRGLVDRGRRVGGQVEAAPRQVVDPGPPPTQPALRPAAQPVEAEGRGHDSPARHAITAGSVEVANAVVDTLPARTTSARPVAGVSLTWASAIVQLRSRVIQVGPARRVPALLLEVAADRVDALAQLLALVGDVAAHRAAFAVGERCGHRHRRRRHRAEQRARPGRLRARRAAWAVVARAATAAAMRVGLVMSGSFATRTPPRRDR
jgi:hypothetical protein